MSQVQHPGGNAGACHEVQPPRSACVEAVRPGPAVRQVFYYYFFFTFYSIHFKLRQVCFKLNFKYETYANNDNIQNSLMKERCDIYFYFFLYSPTGRTRGVCASLARASGRRRTSCRACCLPRSASKGRTS